CAREKAYGNYEGGYAMDYW
nr:immunoglobulin heavy chain junction region [Mus musculus]